MEFSEPPFDVDGISDTIRDAWNQPVGTLFLEGDRRLFAVARPMFLPLKRLNEAKDLSSRHDFADLARRVADEADELLRPLFSGLPS